MFKSGCSAAGAHLVRDQGVAGSNPVTPILYSRIMRILSIIAILCCFTAVSASQSYTYNASSHLLYQYDDEPFDFISVMIDAGYYNAPTDISSIINHMTDKWSDGDYDYTIMPMYSVINYYIKDRTADDILLNVLNLPLVLKHFDVPYIPANINDKALKMRMRYNNQFKKQVSVRFVTVKTSVDYNTVNEIVSNYNFNNNTSLNIPMLKGIYNIEGISDSVFFYDYDTEERYSIADAFITYYYLQHANIDADIRFTPSHAVVVTPKRISSECSREEFEYIVQDISSFIDNASYDVYFYSLFMPYLLYNNELNLMNGISGRMNSMKFPEFLSILGRNPDCVFAPQSDSARITSMDVKKLNNGVTLLYRYRENNDTEISVLIANKLKNEYYYSKAYASDIIIDAIAEKRVKWTVMPLSPLCDYAIITGVFPSNDAKAELTDMMETISSGDIAYKRDVVEGVREQSRAYADTFTYEMNYITQRIDAEDDAKYLSDGELDVLRKKMMDGENIIIAISSSMTLNEIGNIIISNISSSSIYTVPYFNTPVLKVPESRFKRVDQWRISEDAFYYIAVFLNYPSSVYLNSSYAVIHHNVLESAYKYGNNLYFNMMQRSALTILPALSYYLFGDWNVMFNMIGIY